MLKALYINCTLKKSPQKSHTKGIIDISKQIIEAEGHQAEIIRLLDNDIPPGIQPDMTEQGYDKDDWPSIHKKILDSDILIIGTPLWLGENSSECQKLIERLYSMSGKYNDKGQIVYYGKVGGCIITGNEDGAKHASMGVLYSLQHVGFTIPPQADTSWLGEVGPGPSYLDEGSGGLENDFTNRNTTIMTYSLIHAAKALKAAGGYDRKGTSLKDWDEGKKWAFGDVKMPETIKKDS